MANENVTSNDSTTKDFFMRLLSMIALYISVSSFIDLVYQYIESFFPDAWDRFSMLSSRWDIASFIITFPAFLYTTIWLAKECRLHPEKLNLKSRKWLINLTLFLAALIMLCDLGTLIYYFLGNEITIRFLLKVLVLLLITGAVFYYYLQDLKQQWTDFQLKILFWLVVVAAVLVLGYSIYKIEKPYYGLAKLTIPYCSGKILQVTPEEDQVIQQVVKEFAVKQGCNPGNNCLNKWKDHKAQDAVKFSIAWSPSCNSPGVGDSGNGSTFQCDYNNKQVCCWPLGFNYAKVCSPAAEKTK